MRTVASPSPSRTRPGRHLLATDIPTSHTWLSVTRVLRADRGTYCVLLHIHMTIWALDSITDPMTVFRAHPAGWASGTAGFGWWWRAGL